MIKLNKKPSHCNLDSRIGGKQCYIQEAEGSVASVLQRFFPMTFVLSRWEQTNAGIPVVIKPVFGKSEKIVGVGNMTNILGRDAGSKDSLQPIKILEFGIQLCFATPPT